MKKFVPILIILISFNSFSQGYKKINEEDLNNIPLYSKQTYGFSDELPSSYSLEKYVPPIGDQGPSGSCVAWATSYYSMSIIYNSTFGITGYAGKYANRFDPWFLYNQITYLDDNLCEKGVNEEEIFRVSRRIGNKKMLFNPVNINCETNWDNMSLRDIVNYTKPYKITDWESISPQDENSIEKIKYEISEYEYPLIIGVGHYGEGLDDNKVKDGIFKPNYDEENWSGHAMTIVGYDDNINGGSFRVVNSWGDDWGDNGYIWMSYKDYRKFAETTFSLYVSFDKEENLKFDKYTKTWYNDDSYFEGVIETNEESYWRPNGTGILYEYSKENGNQWNVGKWLNGNKNGYFLRITDDGTWYSCWENGNRIDCEEDSYGFASSKLNETEKFEGYLNSLFSETKIRPDRNYE